MEIERKTVTTHAYVLTLTCEEVHALYLELIWEDGDKSPGLNHQGHVQNIRKALGFVVANYDDE